MRRTIPTLLSCAFALSSAACASNVERHWGDAQRANTEAQIANPLASLENERRPVGAVDGLSAENAIGRLRTRESGEGSAVELPTFIQIGAGD
jgi:type IV pilus biogenesis protein CpaD/CtpE